LETLLPNMLSDFRTKADTNRELETNTRDTNDNENFKMCQQQICSEMTEEVWNGGS